MKDLLLLFSLSLSSVIHARACSCVEQKVTKKSVAASYKGGAAIFIGRVKSVTPKYLLARIHARSPFSNKDTTYIGNSQHIIAYRFTFSVSTLFKGQLVDSTISVTSSAKGCGTSFREGQDYLVFGYTENSGGRSNPDYHSDACSGNKQLQRVSPLQLRVLRRLANIRKKEDEK